MQTVPPQIQTMFYKPFVPGNKMQHFNKSKYLSMQETCKVYSPKFADDLNMYTKSTHP